MATIAEIKAQRDVVSGAVDAWEVAQDKASADATQAASAGAIAETASAAAGDSAALAEQKKAAAAAEARKLADMFAEAPAREKGG